MTTEERIAELERKVNNLLALIPGYADLERRVRDLDNRTVSLIRLGPTQDYETQNREMNDTVARVIGHLVPPVDQSARVLTDGSPVTADHHEIIESGVREGQQKGYVVLTAEERAKGFVRPLRRTYVHIPCGVATTMGDAIAETYARHPTFYSGTFCVGCKAHYPIGKDGEFKWDDGEMVGT